MNKWLEKNSRYFKKNDHMAFHSKCRKSFLVQTPSFLFSPFFTRFLHLVFLIFNPKLPKNGFWDMTGNNNFFIKNELKKRVKNGKNKK
jgi:hypothetical protein